jgi:hypothetical protein
VCHTVADCATGESCCPNLGARACASTPCN